MSLLPNLLGLTLALTCSHAVAEPIQTGQTAPKIAETREENARRLIAQADQFKLRVREFHSTADKQVRDANHLKGQAESLQLKLKAGSPEYKAALSQYSQDLNQFKAHADEYNQHIADFDRAVGQCHADEAQYQAHLKDVQLHMQDFHMPDIKPPHICKRLALSSQEAAHYANSMRIDQIRIVEAETELNKAENRLNLAQQENAATTKKAVNNAQREAREQELAQEFGKLKQEYDLLNIEHKAIAGSPAGAATSSAMSAKASVSAKMKK